MTTFTFPQQIDSFTPQLINDVTVVNANHILDLRQSLVEVQQSLIGITTLSYTNTQIIQTGDNIRTAVEKLDIYIAQVAEQLGFFIDSYGSGIANRLDSIEAQILSHRTASGPLDSEGYQVHNVEGEVTGTLNRQDLYNKRFDSGLSNVGTKVTIRTLPSEADLDLQFVVKDKLNNNVAWLNGVGDFYIGGNLQVEGDRVVKGTDVVQNHLYVDGSTILGNNNSIDTVTINGQTTIENNVVISGNLTQIGDLTIGSSGYNATFNYEQIQVVADSYFTGNLYVNGGSSLGNGSDPLVFTGPIYHTGSLYNSNGIRGLGNKFIVENDKVEISTSNTNINSNSVVINKLSINNGDLISSGQTFTFGDLLTSGTNTFIINGTASCNDLIVLDNLQVVSSITTSQTYTNQLTINTGICSPGDVWVATNAGGSGSWQKRKNWSTSVQDGYAVSAIAYDEIFIDTSDYSIDVTLPSSPTLGDRIRLIDCTGTWDINNCFIYPVSTTIMGSLSYQLNKKNGAAEVIYNGTEWRVILN